MTFITYCDSCGTPLKPHEINKDLQIWTEEGLVNTGYSYHRCDNCDKKDKEKIGIKIKEKNMKQLNKESIGIVTEDCKIIQEILKCVVQNVPHEFPLDYSVSIAETIYLKREDKAYCKFRLIDDGE